MTNEKAREVLQDQIDRCGEEYDTEAIEALEVAIKALDSWTKYSDELWKKAYARGCNDVLDKIREEIKELVDYDNVDALVDVVRIINKYKAESEGAE